MKRLKTLTTLTAIAMASASLPALAQGDAPARLPEASIPFVNTGSSIREWQADGEQGLWVQDARKQWYYARMLVPCEGLDFAVRVGFQTRGIDTLDRFANVIVPGYANCPIQSFTKSEAPPKRNEKGKGEQAQAG